MKELDVWYARLDVEEFEKRWSSEISKAARRRLDKNLAKARNKDSLRALAKLTERRDGELRIASRPPLLVPIEELAEREGLDPAELSGRIRRLLDEYRETLDEPARVLAERYRYVDAAHKVVGVGSVGTRAWIALLLGHDEDERPALPPDQGSGALGAGAVRRRQPLPAPRPAASSPASA